MCSKVSLNVKIAAKHKSIGWDEGIRTVFELIMKKKEEKEKKKNISVVKRECLNRICALLEAAVSIWFIFCFAISCELELSYQKQQEQEPKMKMMKKKGNRNEASNSSWRNIFSSVYIPSTNLTIFHFTFSHFFLSRKLKAVDRNSST